MPAPNPLRQLSRAEMIQIDAAEARMMRVVKESKRLHAEKQKEAPCTSTSKSAPSKQTVCAAA